MADSFKVDTSLLSVLIESIYLFNISPGFLRVTNEQNSVSAVNGALNKALDRKMLPHMTSTLTERSAGNVKNRAGAPSQICPVENKGLSYLLGGYILYIIFQFTKALPFPCASFRSESLFCIVQLDTRNLRFSPC